MSLKVYSSKRGGNFLQLRQRGEEVKLGTGTVKWFNESKGFGFIVPDEGGDDVFVHHSSIVADGYRTLQESQKVDFETGEGRKGPEAKDVKPL